MRRPKRYYRHMTREKAQEIRQRYFSRQANQTQLAQEYGVKQHTISRIVSGQVWV